jgi:hypothetical protein
MDLFVLYFSIGKEHILDFRQGLDHILFVLALNAVCNPRDWKKILWVVTSFTLGHSLTLALSTLDIIRFESSVVEFLICLTILLTALLNIFNKNIGLSGSPGLNAWLAGSFGLIHGMGFSTILRTMLAGSDNIIMPLFAFNLGLEFGQIVVVVIFCIIAFLAIEKLGAKSREWTLTISAAIGGIALMLTTERFIALLQN